MLPVVFYFLNNLKTYILNFVRFKIKTNSIYLKRYMNPQMRLLYSLLKFKLFNCTIHTLHSCTPVDIYTCTQRENETTKWKSASTTLTITKWQFYCHNNVLSVRIRLRCNPQFCVFFSLTIRSYYLIVFVTAAVFFSNILLIW